MLFDNFPLFNRFNAKLPACSNQGV